MTRRVSAGLLAFVLLSFRYAATSRVYRMPHRTAMTIRHFHSMRRPILVDCQRCAVYMAYFISIFRAARLADYRFRGTNFCACFAAKFAVPAHDFGLV